MSDLPLRSLPLEQFLEACAAKTPTPGGGAGSAIIGAIGAAFGAMAARYSEGRAGEEAHGPKIATGITALDIARTALLDLAQRDAHAYAGFDQARLLPKGTDAEKATRRRAMSEAARHAAEVPFAAMRIAADALETLSAIAPHLNPRLASDTAVCALALRTALRGLKLNVEANLSSLEKAEANALDLAADEVKERGEWAAQSALATAKEAIRGESAP